MIKFEVKDEKDIENTLRELSDIIKKEFIVKVSISCNVSFLDLFFNKNLDKLLNRKKNKKIIVEIENIKDK